MDSKKDIKPLCVILSVNQGRLCLRKSDSQIFSMMLAFRKRTVWKGKNGVIWMKINIFWTIKVLWYFKENIYTSLSEWSFLGLFVKLCFSVQFFGHVLFSMHSVTSLVKVEMGLALYSHLIIL